MNQFQFQSVDGYRAAEALLNEIGELLAWAQADAAGKLAAARERLAEIESEIGRLEQDLPALAEARDAAKRHLDETRARTGVDGNAVGVAHEIWVDAGVEFSALEGPLRDLRYQRKRVTDEIRKLEAVDRPATPTLEVLIDALK